MQAFMISSIVWPITVTILPTAFSSMIRQIYFFRWVPFWNQDDFKGLVRCLGEIRHIKTGKMKSDLDASS